MIPEDGTLSLWLRLAKNIVYSVSQPERLQQKTVCSTTVSSNTSGTTSQMAGGGQSKQNAQISNASGRPPPGPSLGHSQSPAPSSTVRPSSGVTTAGSLSSSRWILFGVQGSRRSIELEHIEIDDYINDSNFYHSLRVHCRRHRRRWK